MGQGSVEMSHTEVSGAPPHRMTSPAEDPLEGVSELRAEDSVDDRVEGRVEVAQPEEEGKKVLIEFADVVEVAERKHDGHEEERQPADDECPGDDGQRLGGLPLTLGVRGLLVLAMLRRQLRRGWERVADSDVGSGGVGIQAVPVGSLLWRGVRGADVGEGGRGGRGRFRDGRKRSADDSYHGGCDPAVASCCTGRT